MLNALLDKVRTRQHDHKLSEEQKTLALWSEYAAILSRAEKPKAGDDDRLAEIAIELDLSAEIIEIHALAIQEAAQRDATIQREKSIRDRLAKIRAEREKITRKIEDLRTSARELAEEQAAIEDSLNTIESAKKARTTLAVFFPALLDGRLTPEIPAGFNHHLAAPSPAIQHRARQLGIEIELPKP